MEILYQDLHCVVAVKDNGVLSELDARKASMPILLSNAVGGECLPVHRLDRETAGVMVYAKTKSAAQRLSAAFAAHETEKTYYAVTDKRLPDDAGEMRDLLFRDKARGRSYVVDRMRRGVREAHLVYRLLFEKEGLFLYEVRLTTGRTHQIRVQFASRGAPLVGDRRYGGNAALPFSLFAASLSFPHPARAECLSFLALPSEEHAVFSRFSSELREISLQKP